MPDEKFINVNGVNMTQQYIDYINRNHRNSNLNIEDVYEIYNTHSVSEAKKIVDSMVSNTEDLIKSNEHIIINDITLNITDFKKLEFYKNKEAVARMIQHILVTRPGTYPNNPNFGIGIEDYLFELSTVGTISRLKKEIEKQLDLWLNSEMTKANIKVKPDLQYLRSRNNSYTTLAIKFQVFENDIPESKEYDINIYYTGDSTNKQVLSKLDL